MALHLDGETVLRKNTLFSKHTENKLQGDCVLDL